MRKFFPALKDRLLGLWLAARNRRRALDQFARGSDAAQNAVDIFSGEWITSFPPSLHVNAGNKPLYEDGRLQWMTQHVSVRGKRILELGPMEGGHTYQLLTLGAECVTAIESNRRAFLKCLVTKEVLELQSARFLCADFMEYLDDHPDTYDICLASGVLYHMREPLRLLALCAKRADVLFLWTHYYDPAILAENPAQAHRFGPAVPCAWDGFQTQGVRRSYGAQRWNPLHLGSDDKYSVWLTRDAILAALRHVGFTDIVTGPDEPDHPAGPAIWLVARKEGSTAPQPGGGAAQS